MLCSKIKRNLISTPQGMILAVEKKLFLIIRFLSDNYYEFSALVMRLVLHEDSPELFFNPHILIKQAFQHESWFGTNI